MANNNLKKDVIINRMLELQAHLRILRGNAIEEKHNANCANMHTLAAHLQGVEDTCFVVNILINKIVDGDYDYAKVADLLNRPATMNDILS